jgi:hypothetical protein
MRYHQNSYPVEPIEEYQNDQQPEYLDRQYDYQYEGYDQEGQVLQPHYEGEESEYFEEEMAEGEECYNDQIYTEEGGNECMF